MFIRYLILSAKTVKNEITNNFNIFLGVIFCIGVIVIVFCVSGNEMNLKFSNLSGSTLRIYMDEEKNTLNKKSFCFDDIRKLRNLSHIEFLSPEIFFKANAGSKVCTIGCYVLSGTEDYRNFLDFKMIHGRFLTEFECVNKQNVVVIDRNLSIKVFGIENSVGRDLYIENSVGSGIYRVVGVLKWEGKFEDIVFDKNYFCIIPFENSIYKFGVHNEFNYIYAYIKDRSEYENVYTSINNSLRILNYGSKDLYKIESIKERSRILYGIYEFIRTGILFLSFCIFGIYVMYFVNFNMESKIQEVKNCVSLEKTHAFCMSLCKGIALSFILVLLGIGFGVLTYIGLGFIFELKLYILRVFIVFIIYFLIGMIFATSSSIKTLRA